MDKNVSQSVEKIVEGLIELGFKLLIFFIIIFVGFYLTKIIINLIKKARGFNRLDKSVQSFISSFLNILLKVLVFIIGLTYLGIPMTSLITVFGTASLAVGLALQGGLTNMVGGLMLLIFKPFSVGDLIEASGNIGKVKEITIFYTILMSNDNRKIVIPNGALSNQSIINYSSQKKRRLDLDFNISDKNDVDTVKKVLKDVASNSNLVLPDEEIFVKVSSFNGSNIVYTIGVWTRCEDYWNLKFDLEETIKKSLIKNNIV